MAVTTIIYRLRERPLAVRAAVVLTVLAILLIAPIYLGAQWAPAQNALAPWWVALVREPLFARIMLFGEAPVFWPLFVLTWVLAVVSWYVALRRSRKG